MHVSDLADIHVKVIDYLNKKKKSLILNCGYGKGNSVKEIVNNFKKIKSNLLIKYQSRRLGDIAEVYSNTNKLKNFLNCKPKYSDINQIIKSAIRW